MHAELGRLEMKTMLRQEKTRLMVQRIYVI